MRRRRTRGVVLRSAPQPVRGSHLSRIAGQRSVLDVEGVAEGLVEPDSGFEVELADAFFVEEGGGSFPCAGSMQLGPASIP